MSSQHSKIIYRSSLCIAILLAVLATHGMTKAAKPPKVPVFFDLVYCWGATSPDDIGPWCPCVEQILYPDKTFDTFDCLTGQTTLDAGSWKLTRNGQKISFTLFNGTKYEGDRQPDGSYLGTMISNAPGAVGLTGIWQGAFVP